MISLAAWQVGIQTNNTYNDARIRKVGKERIQSELDKKNIVIVAGFQGVNAYGDVTTLGRGGSDTSAVALAAAFHADLCQIYTDVDGVYTADPRVVPDAKKLPEITYADMLELASQARRCFTIAVWSWRKNIMSIWKWFPAWRTCPVQKSRR